MKTTDDYKEKIRKLLALAQSPNEHEARAALLKARQLMAEHKLSEAELRDPVKQEVKDVMTDITCSKRRNPWIINLSAVIGENYCCKAYRTHRHGQQTQLVGFIGFEDDVEICIAIFKYAVECVLSGIEQVKTKNAGYYPQYIKRCCDGYGYGFVVGWSEAFDRQKESNESEWGLVLVMPKEVEEAAQGFKHQVFRAKAEEEIPVSSYAHGYKTGKEFDPKRRLREEVTA